mmetsp:Transcript_70570/g.169083  ORF Transcript_70570/g.169083 Transcript_70570/m.169083 type:complete len:207 (+) Transcript_70570:622-1242(+)
MCPAIIGNILLISCPAPTAMRVVRSSQAAFVISGDLNSKHRSPVIRTSSAQRRDGSISARTSAEATRSDTACGGVLRCWKVMLSNAEYIRSTYECPSNCRFLRSCATPLGPTPKIFEKARCNATQTFSNFSEDKASANASSTGPLCPTGRISALSTFAAGALLLLLLLLLRNSLVSLATAMSAERRAASWRTSARGDRSIPARNSH